MHGRRLVCRVHRGELERPLASRDERRPERGADPERILEGWGHFKGRTKVERPPSAPEQADAVKAREQLPPRLVHGKQGGTAVMRTLAERVHNAKRLWEGKRGTLACM
jgi:hypothetical protein